MTGPVLWPEKENDFTGCIPENIQQGVIEMRIFRFNGVL